MRNDHGIGRDMAMLAGGIVAGVVASRLVPPFLAAVASSNRVRAGGDPFELLVNDHREILSLLDEMVSTGTTSKVQRGKLFMMFKRKLAKHALAEEDVVYPVVRNDSAGGNERLHLYGEHADMKILLYEVENQLRSNEDWRETVVRLRDLIRSHVEEEEKTIFPELRRELTEAQMPTFSGQISREEALIL